MRSIAIVNQKGGCGKTTTAVNLSSIVAEAHREVLVIDCDPQSHASIGLGVDTDNLTLSTYDVLMDPTVGIQDVAQPIRERLKIVPSNVILSAVEQQLSGRPDRENRLRNKLDSCKNDYDYVFVDCPPNIGLLTFNAIVACDEALVVMEPSHFSLHGAEKVIETIGLVRDKLGLRKRVRLLLTLFDRRTRFARQFLSDAGSRFGPGMLKTVIRNTIRFKEAASKGVPISRHAKSCKGAQDYQELAQEILGDEAYINIDDFEVVSKMAQIPSATTLEDWMLHHPGPHFVEEGILFALVAPEAKEVRLAGTFNHWNLESSLMLNRKNNGVWFTILDLEPGRHLYKFLIDGEWFPDPANKLRTDPNDDCIIDVAYKEGYTPPPKEAGGSESSEMMG